MASLWPGSHMMATAVLTANKINTATGQPHHESVHGNQERRNVVNCQRGERDGASKSIVYNYAFW
jgi:hypothetical protein